MKRGLFLSLDGIDGTGKSTQGRLLADWLRRQGLEVVEAVDPGGTPLGQELRAILLSRQHDVVPACAALLFMASRAQLVAKVIRPAVEAGKVVVSDRFVLANIVYQGYGDGFDVEELWRVGRLSTGGLMPDLTLILDLPIEDAARRRDRPADRMESHPPDFHRRVRAGFLTEAARRPEVCRVIDARPAVEVVQAAIRAEVQNLLVS
jgi:dTMP kinase